MGSALYFAWFGSFVEELQRSRTERYNEGEKEDAVPDAQMKIRISLLAAMLCIACALFSGCATAGDASRFVGTWDLRFGTSESNGDSLSEENVASMRALGLEAYLNLDENGSLALVTFDGAKYGNWSVKADNSADATVEDVSATIELSDDTLKLVQPGTTLVFSKGDPKDSSSSEQKESDPDQSSTAQDSEGLSEMVVRGALLDKPITIVDDDICTIVVDGTGFDRWGDPGFNMQLTNNGDKPIDIWVLDPFTVDGVKVATYLFETVDPGKSATTFMQFDVADLPSSGANSLVNVSGMVLVDDDTNTTIAEYPFHVA